MKFLKTFFALVLLSLLVSCSSKNKNIVLWTDCVEFVSYAELYNSVQDEVKIIALYKDAVETELPAAKDEQIPDIVVGTFLQGEMERKLFIKLDSLLSKDSIPSESFYPSLLQAGQFNKKQYLLPVSFNLPALVFRTQNYDYTQNEDLSFNTIKEISKNFNKLNKDGTYNSMGFGPYWNENFLYLIFKTASIQYSTKDKKLSYNEHAFNTTLESIEEWSTQINGGAQNEQDFSFKYLYMPFYEQVQTDRCLFSFATSNQILSLSDDQLSDIDFRWISNDNKIQIEDDIVMMGIYDSSKNKKAAKEFIKWFFNEETQRKILDRKFAMKLKTQTFGIAGGFSSIQSVNQKHFLSYYRSLISNLPVSEKLAAPQTFPQNWAAIKKEIVIPYILASTGNSKGDIKSLPERYAEYISEKETF